MASKAKRRKQRQGKTVRPSTPTHPWDENTEMVSDTALARERIATRDVTEVEWSRCHDGKERKISGRLTVRLSRAESLRRNGTLHEAQAKAAEALILANEVRNRSPGTAIPDLRVDGSTSDPEWHLLRKISGQDPMRWITRQSQRQAVHAVLFQGWHVDRHIDELRKALDIVAERMET